VKAGHRLIEQRKFSSFDLSELASALATLDARGGNLRRGRRLFQFSLTDPNENVVAQARWATTKHFIDMDPAMLRIPGTFEARAWYAFYSGEWEASLREGEFWLRDQPFAASPAVHASYVAAVSLENHDEALRITDLALLANPFDVSLLNNRAYSLACIGRLDEADAALKVIKTHYSPAHLTPQKVVVLATSGLIRYRRGDVAEGRFLYTNAIEAAQRIGDRRITAKAAIFFALEEVRSGSSYSESTEQALRLSSEFITPDFDLLRTRLTREIRAREDRSIAGNL
jgi:tetratricopeptide (TPR) repeat protein